MILCLFGCGKPKATQTAVPPPEPAVSQIVHVGPGDLTRFTEGANRYKAWTVRWKEATLDYTEGEQHPGGDMTSVEGTIFQRDGAQSQFSAQNGHAEKGTGILTLDGSVDLNAGNPAMKMRCDRIVWDAEKQLIVAKGNVTLEGNGYTLKGVSELWCSPDLRHVATPEMYSKS